MKTFFLIIAQLCFLISHTAHAQKVHRVAPGDNGGPIIPPAAGELFVGNWEWSSGGETFHLTLVRDPAYVSPQFPDAGALNTVFGNYSITRNGVLIDQSPTTGTRPYALSCVPADNRSMRMGFKDHAKDKYAYAILTLVAGHPNTLTWKIEPMEHMYFDGDVIPPPGYTVPTSVTLTRQ